MKEKYEKEWFEIKKILSLSHKFPFFRKREIRWVSFGCEIGNEVFGKGEFFTRPAIILEKFFGTGALVIPLTSKKKEGNYFFPFTDLHGTQQYAILPQVRFVDRRRIREKLSEISTDDFYALKDRLCSLV